MAKIKKNSSEFVKALAEVSTPPKARAKSSFAKVEIAEIIPGETLLKRGEKATLEKSILNLLNGPSNQSIERLAFERDPSYTSTYAGLYRAKLKLIPDFLLKRIAIQDDLVASIVQARCNHVSSFGKPREDRFSLGFIIEPKAGVLEDATEEQKEQVQARIDKAVRLISSCGSIENIKPHERLTFAQYLSMSTRSAIVVGRLATEIIWVTDVNTGKRRFHSFRPIDAGTIYRATPQKEAAEAVRRQARKILEQLKNKKLEPEKFEADEYAWIQVIEGRPVQAFTADECYVHNFYSVPDVELDGYPVTPLDTVITAVTTHINIGQHNKMYFQTGRAARGMIVLKSDDADEQVLMRIRQQYSAVINGANNSWKLPIFNVGAEEEIDWMPIDSSSRDMEFQYLSDMNARVILSAFMMSPEELPGWSYLSRGTNAQSLSESNKEYQLEAHRDIGIRPLLHNFESFLNERIFPLIDESLAKICQVKLAGLDAETAEKESVRIQQDMTVHLSYDDIMEKVEKDPVGREYGGKFPLNPQYQQILDKFFTVGEIKEFFFGLAGASKDPSWAYVRDPFWLQWQQIMQAQQAQQQAAQQQAQGGPPQGGGDQGGGQPQGDSSSPQNPNDAPAQTPSQPVQTEKQATDAQQSSTGGGQASQPTDLTRSLDQAIGLLTKSEQKLPASKRKLLVQHRKTLDHILKGLDEDADKASKDILDLVSKYVK